MKYIKIMDEEKEIYINTDKLLWFTSKHLVFDSKILSYSDGQEYLKEKLGIVKSKKKTYKIDLPLYYAIPIWIVIDGAEPSIKVKRKKLK